MTNRKAERGATLLLGMVGFIGIVVIAAMVIDLAAARADRANNQIKADTAATAAAAVLEARGAFNACNDAIGYLAEHLDAPPSGITCGSFPTSCDSSTAAVSEVATFGATTVQFVHPVPDSHPLMSSGAIGATTQPVSPDDGDACDRFAVQLEERHTTFFARVIGIDSVDTAIHAVAVAGTDHGITQSLNLLMLERHDCDVISVAGGGGGQGGIIVQEFIDDINGRVLPGRINADSDATGSCGPKGVISAGGTGAVIRADGPVGCPTEMPALAPGAACGRFEVVAPGPPGCQMPACSSTGLVAPTPTQIPKPLTRASIDWRFNCKSSYPTSYDIRVCPFAPATPPYIDNLVADVGTSGIPTGFRSYTAAGYPCSVSSPLQIPTDNWVVDCSLFRVADDVRFKGGNIIFDGDVILFGPSSLELNTSNANSMSWTANQLFNITQHSGQVSFAFMRDGVMSKGSQATIDMDHVFLYLSPSSELAVGGGSGSLRWISPTIGPFEDLALWSETPKDHGFGGGSSLELEGVLFAPFADFSYSGNGSQQQVAAQFISRTLSTNGGGLLAIQPLASRSVLLPISSATLIR
jgi:hypothetical protein